MITLTMMSIQSPDLPAMRRINEEAFPENERIPVEYFFSDNGLNRETFGIYQDGVFSGFVVVIRRASCMYICYLAVDTARRGLGIGGAALQLLSRLYPGTQIVVDFESVDVPGLNLSQRQRRRSFYLRNGFQPTGMYLYYMDTEFEVAYSGSGTFDEPAFLALLADLEKHVSDFSPQIYHKH